MKLAPVFSDTPRTDAAQITIYEADGTVSEVTHVSSEFARQLERELEKYKRDGWIDVKGNIPQEHDPVLLFHPKEKKAYRFQVSCVPKLHIFKGATHYMNIPDPPLRPQEDKP